MRAGRRDRACTLGNQNPGALGAVVLQVRVNTPLANGTVINNAARISDSNGGTPVVATTATTVTSDHQFTLSKSAASVIQAGQLLTYTINWAVTGDEPAASVTITDAVPAQHDVCGEQLHRRLHGRRAAC